MEDYPGQEFIFCQETKSIISSLNPSLKSLILLIGSQGSARKSFYENLVKKPFSNNLKISEKFTSLSSGKSTLVSSKNRLSNSDVAVYIEEDKIWFNKINLLKQLSEEEEKQIQELSYYSNKLIYFIEADKSLNFDEVQNKLAFFLGLDDIDEGNRDFTNFEIVVCVSITYSAMTESKFREKEKLFKFEKLQEKNIKIGFHYFPYVEDDYDSSEYVNNMRKFYEYSLENLKFSNCNNIFNKKIDRIDKKLKNPKENTLSIKKSGNIPANSIEENKDNHLNFDFNNEVISQFDIFLNLDDDKSVYEKALENAKNKLNTIKFAADFSFDKNKESIIKNEEDLRKRRFDENKIRKKLGEKIREWKKEISNFNSSKEITLWYKKKLHNCAFFNYESYINEKLKTIENIYKETIRKFTVENDFKDHLRKIDDELCTYDLKQSEVLLNKICSKYIESSIDKEFLSYYKDSENFKDLMNLSKSYFNNKIEDKKNQNSHFLNETIDSLNKEFNLKIKEFNKDPYKVNPYLLIEGLTYEVKEKLNKFEHKIFFQENKKKLDLMLDEKFKFLESSIRISPELILDKLTCFNYYCQKKGGMKFIDKTRKNTINVFDVFKENRRDEIKCSGCKKLFSIYDFAGKSYRFEKNFKGELMSIDYD